MVVWHFGNLFGSIFGDEGKILNMENINGVCAHES